MPSTSRLASGVAMVTAAAGLAYKHRDKLTALIKRDGGQETGVSALPPGTSEPAPAAGEANNWTDDPARTAATSGTALSGSATAEPLAGPTGTEAPTASPEPAAEESPWVSPQPPSEGSGDTSPQADAATEPAQATPEDPRTESPPASSGEESPWVSPHPPGDESQAADPRTEEPPGEER